MKDLKRTLTERAGRATAIGSDRLRQRVALTLASGARSGLASEPGRRLSGPLVAAAAAAVTLVAIGAIALILRSGDETSVVDELPVTILSLPPTTEAATTTMAPSVAGLSFPVDGVPPFRATLRFDRTPGGEWRGVASGSLAIVEVWYDGPGRFRFQIVELDGQHLGGPGSYLVGDGQSMGQYRVREESFREISAFEYLSLMFWEPGGSGPFDWAGTCGDPLMPPVPGSFAGRDTVHLVCSTLTGDWELWLDAETGIVLKLVGETEIDDQLIGTSPEGGFEVTSIDYFDGPIPGGETLFAVAAPESAALPDIDAEAVPPLHAVITVTRSQVVGDEEWTGTYTEEIWYRDPDAWRRDTVASDDPEFKAGDYIVFSDGAYTSFEPVSASGYRNAYWIDDSGTVQPPIHWLVAPDFDPDQCTELGIESIAGRSSFHVSCRYEPSVSDQWVDNVVDRWIDVDTGLQLKSGGHLDDGVMVVDFATSVVTLEIDPVFPQGIFDFTTGPGWCDLRDASACERGTWDGTLLDAGIEAPTFRGPLIDGNEFNLADLRGRPVIVFSWSDAHAPGVLEKLLADFESLFQAWSEQVAFVSAPGTFESQARTIAGRAQLTHPVVICYADEIPAGQNSNVLCSPNHPESLWGLGWPYWLMLDEDGRAVDLLRGTDTSPDDLQQMIAAATTGP